MRGQKACHPTIGDAAGVTVFERGDARPRTCPITALDALVAGRIPAATAAGRGRSQRCPGLRLSSGRRSPDAPWLRGDGRPCPSVAVVGPFPWLAFESSAV